MRASIRSLDPFDSGQASWNSRFLSSRRLRDVGRARALTSAAIRHPGLRAEIAAYLARIGDAGTQSDRTWNLYFRVYDQFVAYSAGYRSLVEAACWALPKRGLIGDFGSGTGNFTSALLRESQARVVVAMDLSATGLALTRAKAARLPGGKSRLRTLQGSLLDRTLAPDTLDGALLNNVLYAFSPSDRLAVLRKIRQALKPGGIFVLNDPNPQTKRSTGGVERFLSLIAVSAVENGTPGTEFDLALFAYMNHEGLIGPSKFISASQLASLARRAAFTGVGGFENVYYGATTLLVLRKPAS